MSYEFDPGNNEAEQQTSFIERARHELPVYALASLAALTIAATADRAIAQEPSAGPAKSEEDYYKDQKAIQEAKFPPITQVIDGLEPWFADDAKRGVDPVAAEQHYADELKRGATRRSIYGAEFKPTAKPNVLKLTYHTDPATDISGYGQVTREVTVYTKKPGQKNFHEGGSFTIRNHQGLDATRKVKIADRPRSGRTLIVRTGTEVTYNHLDGTTKSAVRRTPSTRVSR